MARKKGTDTGASAPATPPSTKSAGLRERVVALVSKATHKQPAEFEDDTVISVQVGKPGLDSMGVWDLMGALETEFGVSGKLTEINNFAPLRLSHVVALVQKVVQGS